AGTLLAFGSVLVGATNLGEGSVVGSGAPVLNPLPGASEADADTVAEYHADAPAESAPAAPDQVSTQAATETAATPHPRLGPVHRNAPISVGAPAAEPGVLHSDAAPQSWTEHPPAPGQTPPGPTAPVSPVLDPATHGVGRVGEILTPDSPAPDSPGKEHADDETEVPRQAPGPSPRDTPTALPTRGTPQPVQPDAAQPDQDVADPRDEVTGGLAQPVVKTVTQPVHSVIAPVAAPVARPVIATLASLLP
ncbi:MAG TPA: hypothetical protein VFO16_09215, partial [Pseudonocardiaceae bacterium]|nr:hypothetical protein [Pseudonocardiaceae bacterium]